MVSPPRAAGRSSIPSPMLSFPLSRHVPNVTPANGGPANGTERPSRPYSVGSRALRGFGLSAREARMYLALIEAGPSSAREATGASGLQRATAYRVLGRLIARGLVSAESGWPQRFSAMPLRTLIERNISFLRDEIELSHWLVPALPAAPEGAVPTGGNGFPVPFRNGGMPERRDPAATGTSLTVLSGSSEPRLLRELRDARQSVDAVIRPLDIPSSLRPQVAVGLSRAAARGVPVRVLLDYRAADRRLASTLRRLRQNTNLEVRHYTPLGGHFYVLDGHEAIRFSPLQSATSDPGCAIVSNDLDFVRSQTLRFEGLWGDAMLPISPRSLLRDHGSEPRATGAHAGAFPKPIPREPPASGVGSPVARASLRYGSPSRFEPRRK